MLHLSEFVWTLRSSVLVVFNNFLLVDRSKISINQKRFFIALSLYPLSFFTNTPFNKFTSVNLILRCLSMPKSGRVGVKAIYYFTSFLPEVGEGGQISYNGF